VDIVYLVFSKGFNIVSHNNLEGKLVKYRLDKWTVRRTEKKLNSQAWNVMIISTKCSWRPVTHVMEIQERCGAAGKSPEKGHQDE